MSICLIIYVYNFIYTYKHSVSVGNFASTQKTQALILWKRNFGPVPQSVGAGLLIVLSLTSVVSPSGLKRQNSVQRWRSQGAPMEPRDLLSHKMSYLRVFVLLPKNHGFFVENDGKSLR